MGFWDDFGEGFQKPFVWVFNKAEKIDHIGETVATGAADIVGGIGNAFSGNSSILVYCGIALVVVVVLPKLLDRAR